MNILLLEDDKVLAETIQEVLGDEGYDCHIALTGDRALEASYEMKFDLYLLDINVPGMLGTTLLSELRESGDATPAIFITSLADETSVLKGYQSGCDDYIRKPFTLAELRVRISALLKRVYGFNEPLIKITPNITFDITTFELTSGSETVRLPKKEGQLLSFFIKNRGKILSKDEMIEAIWSDSYPSDAVIRVHISSIKKHLGAELLTTIKGVGYKLEKL